MKSNLKSLNGLCLAITLLLFVRIEAQRISGVYLTGKDFISNQVSFPGTKDKKCKLIKHEKPYKNFINVKYNDSTYTIIKDSIFGYVDQSGTIFRYQNKIFYPIINPNESILMYRIETHSGTPKSPSITINHYFSKDAFSPIQRLTVNNLENTFAENKAFSEFLEIHFKDDESLTEYDNVHHVFKVNRLLQLSNNHKTN